MTLDDLLVKEGIKKKKENTLHESILDPVHKVLAKDVWVDEKFKPSHRNFILEKLYKWLKEMDVNKKPEKVYVLGSITGFQYNDLADIDINVVMGNISDSDYDKLVDMLPNGENLPDTEHPVNYYIAKDSKTITNKDSSYDLLNDKWDKKPDKKDVKVPHAYVIEIAKFFMAGIDDRISEYERDKLDLDLYKSYLEDKNIDVDKDEIRKAVETKEQEVMADLDSLKVAKHMARAFRIEAFEDGYENDFLIDIKMPNSDYSINNMVYKLLEQYGYLDKLIEYSTERKKYK